jgi:hypothetical protein
LKRMSVVVDMVWAGHVTFHRIFSSSYYIAVYEVKYRNKE